MKSNKDFFLEERFLEENTDYSNREIQQQGIKEIMYSKDKLIVEKTEIPNTIICTLENIGL